MANSLQSQPGNSLGTGTLRFTESTVVLAPGKAQTVGLGAYEASEPMPAFSIVYEPALDKELIGAALERLDIPGKGKYLAVYHFHNFSDKYCSITVQLRR